MKNNFKISLFNTYELQRCILYTLSTNTLVTSSSLKSLQEYVNLLDIDNCDDDFLKAHVLFLSDLLKYRIDLNQHEINSDILELIIRDSSIPEEIDNIIDCINDNWPEPPTDSDILFTEKLFKSQIQTAFIYEQDDRLNELSVQLKAGTYDDKDVLFSDYKQVISEMYNKFVELENTSKDALNDFDSDDETFISAIQNTIQNVNQPIAKLRTGVKMKNSMLSGGYEAGRLYLVLGLQGGGKSKELLRIALETIEYNNDKFRRLKKKPVILFVSQENDLVDTMGRIWSYYNDDPDANEMKNKSVQEVQSFLNERGFLKESSFAFRFRASRSINVAGIEKMIEDIEQDKSKQVVMVIQDYLKRIKPNERLNSNTNSYEELGAVTDDLCTLAKMKKIPIISAMQFNRSALKMIEEAVKKNKNNPSQYLSVSDIGESTRIIDNTDVIYAIYEDIDRTTNTPVLTYKCLKYRGERKRNAVDYFAHPYELNMIKLKSDCDAAQSLSIMQLGDELSGLDPVNARNQRMQKVNKIGGRQPSTINKDAEEMVNEN